MNSKTTLYCRATSKQKVGLDCYRHRLNKDLVLRDAYVGNNTNNHRG